MQFVLAGRKELRELPMWVTFSEDNPDKAIVQAKRTEEASGWIEVRLYKIEEIKID